MQPGDSAQVTPTSVEGEILNKIAFVHVEGHALTLTGYFDTGHLNIYALLQTRNSSASAAGRYKRKPASVNVADSGQVSGMSSGVVRS